MRYLTILAFALIMTACQSKADLQNEYNEVLQEEEKVKDDYKQMEAQVQEAVNKKWESGFDYDSAINAINLKSDQLEIKAKELQEKRLKLAEQLSK